MIRNGAVTLRYVTLRYANHLNFSRFSIAKIFSTILLKYFISCSCFADILLLILIEEKEETSLV